MSVSDQKEGYIERIDSSISSDVKKYVKDTAVKTKDEETVNVEVAPNGYTFANEHEKLGGDKGKNNFIAVVHIDGNQMGSRVSNLEKYIEADSDGFGETLSGCSEARKKFEIWRYYSRKFSESIDFDFKKALVNVYDDISKALEDERISSSLKLKKDEDGQTYFPLRKIIAAGDDICFVTEGRLGIESAVKFIEHLAKQKNSVDGESYNACAGVAIVHQKYPFYRAYDLAEQLCKNVKEKMVKKTRELRENAGREDVKDGCLSAIDWHVEYGEMMGDLDEIRERMVDLNRENIFARPYQINAIENVMNENPYAGYRRMVTHFNHFVTDRDKILDIAKHKQKEMRGAIKNSKQEYERFCKMNKITENLGMNANRAQIFDALESSDLFLPL